MPVTEPKIYLDTELRPNASLSLPAMLVVLGLVAVCSFVAGMSYLLAGAWPVFGFLSADVVLIWLAFHVSWRRQQQVTFVRVDTACVRLWHMQRGKPDRTVDLPTAFVRIVLDSPETDNSFLSLQYGAKAWIIGRFLTPVARENLARDLRRAVQAARTNGIGA